MSESRARLRHLLDEVEPARPAPWTGTITKRDEVEEFWAAVPRDPWAPRSEERRRAWAIGTALVVTALIMAAVSVFVVKSIDTTDLPATPTTTITRSGPSVGQLWYQRHLLLLGDLEATASTAANAAAVDDLAGTAEGCRNLAPLAERAAAIERPPVLADQWARAVTGFRDGAAMCEAGLTTDSSQFKPGALALVAALAALEKVTQGVQ